MAFYQAQPPQSTAFNPLAAISSMLAARKQKLEAAQGQWQSNQLKEANATYAEVRKAYEQEVASAEAQQAKYADDVKKANEAYATQNATYQQVSAQAADWEAAPGKLVPWQQEYNTTFDNQYYRDHPEFKPTFNDYARQKANQAYGGWNLVPESVAAAANGTWTTGRYQAGAAPTLALPQAPTINIGDAPSFNFTMPTSPYDSQLQRATALSQLQKLGVF